MGLSPAHVPGLGAWLAETPHVDDGGLSLGRDFAAELRSRGLPLWRMSFSLLTMHPEVLWRNLHWHEGRGISTVARHHDLLADPFYTRSPIARLSAGAAPIRVRLDPGDLPFPVCEDLRAEGGTDYLAQGLPFRNGQTSFATWATRREGGFDHETLQALEALRPHLARRLELESAYYATRSLLEVYLGKNAAQRVLSGAFRRGGGVPIEAAIWFCDLRDFTSISDRTPPGQVVELLDAYFERVAGQVAEHGGEVLKFVGDAVLAIFPVEGDARKACRSALSAAVAALSGLGELSAERVASGAEPLHAGVALHLGQVMYGNIGARDRLDFTVISSSVNEASRLESLCKTLGTPLTLSQAFVAAAQAADVVDLGEHRLKGVAAPLRVFTLERFAATTRA